MTIKLKHVALLASVIFALISCHGFAKKVVYEHKPSEFFYKNGIIRQKELEPFTENGILLTLKFEHFGWLNLYSEEIGQKLQVSEISVQKHGNTLYREKLNTAANINEESNWPALFVGHIKLFPDALDTSQLEKWAGEEGVFWVEVTYEIDGREKTMRFRIERRVEWWPIFPT